MPFAPPTGGENVKYHRRRPELDCDAVITSVLQPGGSQVNLSYEISTGGPQTANTVEHISFAGDPQAAAAYWSYGDDLLDGFS